MKDANGRPIEVGDWVANGKAILGEVVEITGGLVYLGDGIAYEGHEVVTLSGYVWVICLDCNTPWVKDKLQDEVCPFCASGRYELDKAASPASVAACR